MTVNRFHQTYLVNLTAALLGLMIFCNGVFAQNCPSKSIRMIVTFPPGGGADSLARTVAPKLTEIGGLQVVRDSKDVEGPVVAFDAKAWRAFISEIGRDGFGAS